MSGIESLRMGIRTLEDWWFDTTRGVETAGDARRASGTPVVGEVRDSYVYLPVRVKNARAALNRLPIGDSSGYAFLDMGSGKGRMLFVAAERPFAQVIGVEFDETLHSAAMQNVAAYRKSKRQQAIIKPVLGNAAEYEFPSGPLVVYLYNPFGPEIMNSMLDNLERALTKQPRHIVLIMLVPDHADVAARRPWLREIEHTRRHRIFEAGSEANRT